MRSSREVAKLKENWWLRKHSWQIRLLWRKSVIKKRDVCFHISRCTSNTGRAKPRNESWNASWRYQRTVMEEQRIRNLLCQRLIISMKLIWEIVKLLGKRTILVRLVLNVSIALIFVAECQMEILNSFLFVGIFLKFFWVCYWLN